jgi:hypothetical protein
MDEDYLGMSPEEEARSLRENPLPPENGVVAEDDTILPTRIAIIEGECAKLRERLKDLESSKTLLLDHAIKINVLEDESYKIEKKIIKGNRVADMGRLKEMFPVQMETYLLTMKDKISRDFKADAIKAAEKMRTVVNLGIADSIFGKENVTRCSTVPESAEYKVVKKSGRK